MYSHDIGIDIQAYVSSQHSARGILELKKARLSYRFMQPFVTLILAARYSGLSSTIALISPSTRRCFYPRIARYLEEALSLGTHSAPQSLLQLIPKRRASAMVARCAARECMCFSRPLERYRRGEGCAVDASSRERNSSCTERNSLHTTVETWCLDYTQSASFSPHRAL